MFTGIVQMMGSVASVEPAPTGATLRIDAASWGYTPDKGASVAVNGCCLTAVLEGETPGRLRFDVVPETLERTNLGTLAPGDPVNLEHAAMPTTLFGGHLVQGHVDGLALVHAFDCDGGEARLVVEPPAALLDCIVEKGSVTLDGVSLTVARLDGPRFEVALIPETLRETTLGRAAAGHQLNIEADYVAKTIVHWLERRGVPGA